jgi:hypothetical protein
LKSFLLENTALKGVFCLLLVFSAAIAGHVNKGRKNCGRRDSGGVFSADFVPPSIFGGFFPWPRTDDQIPLWVK